MHSYSKIWITYILPLLDGLKRKILLVLLNNIRFFFIFVTLKYYILRYIMYWSIDLYNRDLLVELLSRNDKSYRSFAYVRWYNWYNLQLLTVTLNGWITGGRCGSHALGPDVIVKTGNCKRRPRSACNNCRLRQKCVRIRHQLYNFLLEWVRIFNTIHYYFVFGPSKFEIFY